MTKFLFLNRPQLSLTSNEAKSRESTVLTKKRTYEESSRHRESRRNEREKGSHSPKRVRGRRSRRRKRSRRSRASEDLDRHRRRSRSPVSRPRYGTSPERVYKGKYSRSPEHHHSSRSHIPSYKHRRSRSPEYENTRDRFIDTRWQMTGSGSRDSDFVPQVKYPRRMDNKFNSEVLNEPSTSGLTKNTIETPAVIDTGRKMTALDSKHSDFAPQVKYPRRMDNAFNSDIFDEPSTSGLTRNTIKTPAVIDTGRKTKALDSKHSDFAPQVKYPRRMDNAFNSDIFDEPSISGLTRNTIETPAVIDNGRKTTALDSQHIEFAPQRKLPNKMNTFNSEVLNEPITSGLIRNVIETPAVIDTGRKTTALDSKHSDFAPQRKLPKKMDNAIKSEVLDEPSTSGLTRNTIQTPAVSEGTGKKESVKLVEILTILSYMKDKLGVYGVPVSIVYDKAVTLEKKGFNPRILLDDEDIVTLLMMLSDKLTTFISEGGASAIEKSVMLKAQSCLKTLLRQKSHSDKKDASNIENSDKKGDLNAEKSNRKEDLNAEKSNKKDDLNAEKSNKNDGLNAKVNIGQIARLTVNKNIVETLTVIKNSLISGGISSINRNDLELVYVLVKEEQLKISKSKSQHEFERGSIVPQRQPISPPAPVISSRRPPERPCYLDHPFSNNRF